MEREISFRAWNVENREWFDGNVLFLMSKTYIPTSTEYFFSQYTGLKDINLKKIFEGDICLRYYNPDIYIKREPDVGVVKWVDFGGRYTIECKHKGNIFYNELYENLINKEYPRSVLEVIGNIFEHPHLIPLPHLDPS